MGNKVEASIEKIVIEPLTDFHCLESFCSGVEAMDVFIRGGFRISVDNHYCSAYIVKLKEELVGIFALSFDSLDLDAEDREELQSGISSTGIPSVDINYKDTLRMYRTLFEKDE